MQAYCLKCHARREASEIQQVTMKNGKPGQRGKCVMCKATLFKLGAPTHVS